MNCNSWFLHSICCDVHLFSFEKHNGKHHNPKHIGADVYAFPDPDIRRWQTGIQARAFICRQYAKYDENQNNKNGK